MKTFITSDLHFDHRGIMGFCPETRPYKDVDHMNSEMIREFNLKVGPNDLTYFLGDIAFCQAQKAAGFMRALNGRKILIQGNHDSKTVKDISFRSCFEEIHQYLEINYAGSKICMFHYPISEWNQCHRGSIHLYGHLHQNASGLERWRARNVGFDCTGQVVSLLDDIVVDALKGEVKKHGDSKSEM